MSHPPILIIIITKTYTPCLIDSNSTTTPWLITDGRFNSVKQTILVSTGAM